MYRKFLIYLMPLILAACADSFDPGLGNEISPDGEFNIVLDIPGMVVQKSRSDLIIDPEYKIDDIRVLVYEGEGNAPVQIERFYADPLKNTTEKNSLQFTDEDEPKLKLTFRLDENLRRKSDMRFYFIANSLEDNFNLEENRLKSEAVSVVKNEATDDKSFSLIMCGEISQENLQKNQTVVLHRNAAKVTVSDDNAEDRQFYPYILCGDASQSPRMAYFEEEYIETALTTNPSEKDNSSPEAKFFHPSKNVVNDNGIGGRLYIITKLNYEGTDYFYRLDFVGKDESNKDRYLNARPNHWYQFVITDILTPGYKTPAEAALYPFNGLKYEIHDHAPVSYNMTSDGFRELGVSHSIEYSGTSNKEGSWSDKELYVKFFSKDVHEIPATSEDVINLIKVPSWLELSDAELMDSDDITGGSGFEYDKNDSGKVYRMKLRFKPSEGTGSFEDKIAVCWKSLEREVPIIWLRNFTGADISSASLEMVYNGETTHIDDYWGFLSSTDEPTGAKNDALWGIQSKANNGKVRNHGFHFPVMYGTSGNLAEYSYNLIFNKLEKLKKANVSKVEVSKPTDSHVTCTENSSSEFYSYTIERNNNDGYEYTIGDIDFNFYFKDGTTQAYSYRTYHTGFFHKDSQSHRLDSHDEANYYYYEVIPVTVDGQKRYLLDRNLAAKSAEMYIQDVSGNSSMGNPDAAGGYFTVAYQKRGQDGESLYMDPVLYDKTEDRVSPPGYRIPLKNVWGGIRTSPSFHNEAADGNYPAYYDTGNPLIGKIYFPKPMLYMNGGIKGDTRTGYYWTGTPATGTEKDEIGKWLNMFVLSEHSTSYINGCVTTNVPGLEYGASVRCINDIADDKATNVTSFNVSGATHVFLYKEEDGVRIPTTAWPGHSVGNYATMSGERWFGFSFESPQFSPDDLYVIFNFVDQNGIIYTYSRKETDGSTQRTNHLSPSQCAGWKVTDEFNKHIIPSEAYLTIDGISLVPADKTALGNWWRCGMEEKNGSPFVLDYRNTPKILYMVGSATQGGWNLAALTEIKPDIDNQGIYTWTGDLKIGEFKASFSELRDDGFWNSYFIRPEVNHTKLSETELVNSPMIEKKEIKNKEDNKWFVTVPGVYSLTFNVNNMSFSAKCLNTREEGTKVVTVVNNLGWENIYIYYWRSVDKYNFGKAWPGTYMEKESGSENKFRLAIPESADYIIFHNNSGQQTQDIELNDKLDYENIPIL